MLDTGRQSHVLLRVNENNWRGIRKRAHGTSASLGFRLFRVNALPRVNLEPLTFPRAVVSLFTCCVLRSRPRYVAVGGSSMLPSARRNRLVVRTGRGRNARPLARGGSCPRAALLLVGLSAGERAAHVHPRRPHLRRRCGRRCATLRHATPRHGLARGAACVAWPEE